MSAAAQPAIFHTGFGEKLRLAREGHGWSPTDVAAKLKLGPRQIEALEAEDFAQLPGEVFIRGFVRNYARLVEVDPEQLIVPVDIHSVVAETVTAPSEGLMFSSPGLRRWVLMPMLALAFFVALVAALYYWLRQGEDALVTEMAPVATAPVPATPEALPVPLPAAAPEQGVAPADLAPGLPGSIPLTQANEPAAGTSATPAVTGAAPMVPGAAPAPVQAAATAPVASAAAPIPVAKPATVAMLPGGKPAPLAAEAAKPVALPLPAALPAATTSALKSHTLRFVPALDAWIQVVDGKGKRYSKLVRAGEAEVFAGEPPFKLVVGEAAQVQLSYDGHSIDLTPYIGQKVARLTLE